MTNTEHSSAQSDEGGNAAHTGAEVRRAGAAAWINAIMQTVVSQLPQPLTLGSTAQNFQPGLMGADSPLLTRTTGGVGGDTSARRYSPEALTDGEDDKDSDWEMSGTDSDMESIGEETDARAPNTVQADGAEDSDDMSDGMDVDSDVESVDDSSNDGTCNCADDDGASVSSCDSLTERAKHLLKEFPNGCQHYRRNCKLVCGQCQEVHTCRHCHNEKWEFAEEEGPVKAHTMDKSKVTEIVCICCDERQPVSNQCRQCGVQFGKYFCEHCRFWDQDESKQCFHCDGCGMCRVGGRENYFHCNTCNACMHVSSKESHQEICRPNLMSGQCPVCFEDLYTSVKHISILRCGHAMHHRCLKQYVEYHHNCPMCKKLITSPDHPSVLKWVQKVDEAIQAHPIPEESQHDVDISCRECQTRSSVAWHPIGLKCANPACGNYNTYQV